MQHHLICGHVVTVESQHTFWDDGGVQHTFWDDECNAYEFLARVQDKTPTDLIKEAVTHLANQVTEDMLRQNLMTACGIWRDRQDMVNLRELRGAFDRFAMEEVTTK